MGMKSSPSEVDPDQFSDSSSPGPASGSSSDSKNYSGTGRQLRGRTVALIVASSFALAVVIAFTVLFFRGKAAGSGGKASQSSPARTGAVQTLRLRGMTAALGARSVQALRIAGQQVGTLTITKLIPSGTRVKQGDLLVEFDRQAQLRDFINKQAQSDDENQKVIRASGSADSVLALRGPVIFDCSGVVEIVAVKASKRNTEPQPSIMRLQAIQYKTVKNNEFQQIPITN